MGVAVAGAVAAGENRADGRDGRGMRSDASIHGHSHGRGGSVSRSAPRITLQSWHVIPRLQGLGNQAMTLPFLAAKKPPEA